MSIGGSDRSSIIPQELTAAAVALMLAFYVKRDSSNMPIVDSFAVQSLNTETREIFDDSGNTVAGWGAGESYGFHVYGGLQVGNIFSEGSYVDFGSGGDVSILTKSLVDASGVDSVDPKNRQLVNSSSSLVFDWQNSTIYDNGTPVAYWSGFGGFLVLPVGIAVDTIWTSSGSNSISPLNRQLYDSFNNPVFDWENKTADGSWNFSGDLTANNLSGTNTGDQDLSAYATTAAVTAALAGIPKFTYFV